MHKVPDYFYLASKQYMKLFKTEIGALAQNSDSLAQNSDSLSFALFQNNTIILHTLRKDVF